MNQMAPIFGTGSFFRVCHLSVIAILVFFRVHRWASYESIQTHFRCSRPGPKDRVPRTPMVEICRMALKMYRESIESDARRPETSDSE